MTHHPCRECGTPFTPRRTTAVFCSGVCKRAFNNRRAMRGAELYDLFLASRFDRQDPAVDGVWSVLCRMAHVWRAQDEAERDGRKSWCPAKEVRGRTARYAATIVAQNYRAGR